ncbi:PspC domain-containing protein [Streptomyces sp. NPDC001922]|uniref:PspC domain-containing protein n=1 Tax=Streptomyces sp. NPDC001922 TaxID=3364624 RepID=UPI00367AFA39
MNDQQTDAGTPPAPGHRPSPPLRRSRGGKVVAGVCGGLGRHYDVDPVVFRVVLAVLSVAGGFGLLAYGFAWLMIPLDGEDENELRRMLSGRVEGPALTALLCALVGCGLLLSMLDNGPVLVFAAMLSAAVLGAAHRSQDRRRTERESPADGSTARTPAGSPPHAPAHGVAPPETTAPPAPGAPSWWRDPLTKDGTSGPTGTGYLWGPAEVPRETKDPVPGRNGIGGRIFLLAAATCTVVIALSWDARPLGTTLQLGLAAALGVFGLGTALSSRFGRTGAGTVVMALLTCALMASVAALPRSVTTDWRERSWTPATAAAVEPGYELGTGSGTLDLSGVELRKGQRIATGVSLGFGRLTVVVPDGATVRLHAEVGLGELRLPGDGPGDADSAPDIEKSVTLQPAKDSTARGTVELDVEAGVGQVEVVRATS